MTSVTRAHAGKAVTGFNQMESILLAGFYIYLRCSLVDEACVPPLAACRFLKNPAVKLQERECPSLQSTKTQRGRCVHPLAYTLSADLHKPPWKNHVVKRARHASWTNLDKAPPPWHICFVWASPVKPPAPPTTTILSLKAHF